MTEQKTHQELYPEQYSHPLVGKKVRVVINGDEKRTGTVARVMGSRFGSIADFGDSDVYWAAKYCHPIE